MSVAPREIESSCNS